MVLQARLGFPQVGEWCYKLVWAFPKLGNGVTSSFWLSPGWGMVLQACFGFPQVGKWCYKLVWAFPETGQGLKRGYIRFVESCNGSAYPEAVNAN